MDDGRINSQSLGDLRAMVSCENYKREAAELKRIAKDLAPSWEREFLFRLAEAWERRAEAVDGVRVQS